MTSEPCTAQSGTAFYDLASLAQTEKDYTFQDQSHRNITLNVCRDVLSETWKLEGETNVGGFLSKARGDFSIGQTNTTLQIVGNAPLLVMTGGSPCSDSNSASTRASTAIRFLCDPAISGAGTPELITELPPGEEDACTFLVEWRTSVACPITKDVLGTGTGAFIAVFATVLLIALVVFLVAGTLYNRFMLGLRGMDQLPRLSFAPCRNLLKRFRRTNVDHIPNWGSWGRRRNTRVPRDFREEEEPVFSAEEEEEETLNGQGALVI